MPWCPKCRDEYREGFTRCSTCGAELVDTLEKAGEYAETPRLTEPAYAINDFRKVKTIISILEDHGVPCRIDEGTVYVSRSHMKKARRLLEGEDVPEGAEEMNLAGEDPNYDGDDLMVMGIAKRERDLPKICAALEEAGIRFTLEGKGIFVASDDLEDALEATEPYEDLLLSEAETEAEYAETDDAIEGMMNSIPGATWYWGGDAKEDESPAKEPFHKPTDPAPTCPKPFDVPEAFRSGYKPVRKDERELGEEPKKKRGLFRKKDEQDW